MAVEFPKGLFDRIILAIKREQELRKTKRLLFGFLFLLFVSLVTTPLSFSLLLSQIKSSGIAYFISTALGDLSTFITLWKDFCLAIIEAMPITGLLAFAVSIGTAVFTLRLFLYKKDWKELSSFWLPKNKNICKNYILIS